MTWSKCCGLTRRSNLFFYPQYLEIKASEHELTYGEYVRAEKRAQISKINADEERWRVPPAFVSICKRGFNTKPMSLPQINLNVLFGDAILSVRSRSLFQSRMKYPKTPNAAVLCNLDAAEFESISNT